MFCLETAVKLLTFSWVVYDDTTPPAAEKELHINIPHPNSQSLKQTAQVNEAKLFLQVRAFLVAQPTQVKQFHLHWDQALMLPSLRKPALCVTDFNATHAPNCGGRQTAFCHLAYAENWASLTK